MEPELMPLRYLVALAAEQNFTRAAERCHVTQQSLSAGIARLEQLVGVRLVERSTRRVHLTPAGERLAAGAESALTDIRAAVDAARAIGAGYTGRLVIGFHGPGAEVAADLLERYRLRRPEVEIALRRADFADPTAGITAGGTDIAIVPAPLEHPDLAAVAIASEPMMVVLARAHPLAARERLCLADLGDTPIAEMPNPHADELLAQWNRFWTLADHRPGVPTAPAEFRAVEEWLAGQRHARHISTGPASAARLYPARDIVHRPLTDVPPVTWRLLYRPDRLSPQAAALLELATADASAAAPVADVGGQR